MKSILRIAPVVALLASGIFAQADFLGYADISLDLTGYTGGDVSDFPVLVRITNSQVPGIYAAVQNNGADLKFTDPTGNTEYPFEVDTWNPSGESLVWVKLPLFTSTAAFRMYYGDATKTVNSSASQVWSDYDLVCHVNGTANDSSPNHFEGVLNTGDYGRGVSDAKVGSGWGVSQKGHGPAMVNHIYEANLPDTVFTVSYWIRYSALPDEWTHVVGPGSSSWALNAADPDKSIEMRNSGSAKIGGILNGVSTFAVGNWAKVDAVYNDTTLSIYFNGVLAGGPTTVGMSPQLAWIKWIHWGGETGASPPNMACSSCQAADFDECRIYGSAADADRIAADYFVVQNDVCVFGGGASKKPAPVFSGCSVTKTSGGFTVSGQMVSGEGAIELLFNDSIHVAVTSGEEEGPYPFSLEVPVSNAAGGLYSDTTYTVKVHGYNDDGNESTWTFDGTIYTGALTVQKVADAVEDGSVNGSFRISRGASGAATANALTVYYSTSGDAVAGVNYEALSGTATIDAGQSSVDVPVIPCFDLASDDDKSLVVTLDSGLYSVGSPDSATVVIENSLAPANSIYVDSQAAAGGNGSFEHPYQTIKAGVAAALEGWSVWVRGGSDREYVISSVADIVEMNIANVTVRGFNGTSPLDYTDTDKMARVVIADAFSANIAGTYGSWGDSQPFKISADGCRFSGFRFVMDKHSLASDAHGPLFGLNASGFDVDACEFLQTDSDNTTGSLGLFYPKNWGASDLHISKCSFVGACPNGLKYLFRAPKAGTILSECYFTNVVQLIVFAESAGDLHLISNKVINCGSGTSGFISPADNGGPSNSTIAYNCFARTPTASPFYLLSHGGKGASFEGTVEIHHNTVIGYDCAFFTKRQGSTDNSYDTWTPNIHHNLFLMNENGSAILEKTSLSDDMPSLWGNSGSLSCGFLDGSVWQYNAVLGAKAAVTAPLAGYDLDSHLSEEGNVSLSAVPAFLSLDPFSPDFCRVKSSVEPQLVLGKHEWIGAVQPMMMGAGAHIFFY